MVRRPALRNEIERGGLVAGGAEAPAGPERIGQESHLELQLLRQVLSPQGGGGQQAGEDKKEEALQFGSDY